MRTGSRFAGALGAVSCVAAAVAMCVASLLPYTGGNWGDGLPAGNWTIQSSQVTISIISGSDAWLVLGTAVALGLLAACHLAGLRLQTTSFVALAMALVALGLALKLPDTWKQDGVVYGEPYLLYSGFYVFLAAAATAVLGALLMFVAGFVGLHTKAATPLPSPN